MKIAHFNIYIKGRSEAIFLGTFTATPLVERLREAFGEHTRERLSTTGHHALYWDIEPGKHLHTLLDLTTPKAEAIRAEIESGEVEPDQLVHHRIHFLAADIFELDRPLFDRDDISAIPTLTEAGKTSPYVANNTMAGYNPGDPDDQPAVNSAREQIEKLQALMEAMADPQRH